MIIDLSIPSMVWLIIELLSLDDTPCLYLPCLFTKDLPSSSIQYGLLIRLLQNTTIGRVASALSLSPMNNPALLQGKPTYHSINNKMNEYSTTEEVGFDIDGDDGAFDSSPSDEDTIDPWMIDIIGVKDTCTYHQGVKGTTGTASPERIERHIDLIDTVHTKVVCSENSIQDHLEDVNYGINKLLPRLRFESLTSTIQLLKQYKVITEEQGDRERRMFQVSD